MKHFWLTDDRQAIMDAATSTAADYTHIGLFACGQAWKRKVEGMVGSKVDPANYKRTWKICRDNLFRMNGQFVRFDAAIRLTARQAMFFKLRFGGSDEAVLGEDPTGEYWGNMAIAESDLGNSWQLRGLTFDSFDNYGSMVWFTRGQGYGPTIANVGNHLQGLPRPWARALVWDQARMWHRASRPFEPSSKEIIEAVLSGKAEGELDSPKTEGQAQARAWWKSCQSPQFREQHGCEPLPGESSDPL
ncbi:hypothetical protein [Sphingomonas aerophila]|uniref:Uncharacterized protein n=1 Tax=Sphingomonas aerophila TaxID=1344948 RepID=A0A7W9BES9_9SPHN|nr:hypothetical protein [Sphingomonas aerophila]MBB5715831.1 hypothetical protein [Sphingomonas aerophila]